MHTILQTTLHNTLRRALFSATAVLVGTAMLNVGRSVAQQRPTDDSTMSASSCGGGRQITCGSSTTERCTESTMLFGSFDDVVKGKNYTFGKPQECVAVEFHWLYKDS